MPRIKNHKPIIIILLVLLFVLSAAVFFAPDMKPVQRVKVQHKSITISQGTPSISNTDVGLNKSSASIQNEDIATLNKSLNMNHSDVNLGEDSGNINFKNVENHKVKYKNSDPFDDIGKGAKFHDVPVKQQSPFHFQNTARYEREMEQYRYTDINWGTWKSRFVNRILDDSLYIKSLDTYGIGTWFYYSFVVTNTGEIHDVVVFSLYLTDDDKMKIRALIRSYEKMPITIFPENTKRTRAKIKAIMLLGDTEQKANSSSFVDTERVKVRY